jgi:O-antigen/teichoic acid export membrane protein
VRIDEREVSTPLPEDVLPLEGVSSPGIRKNTLINLAGAAIPIAVALVTIPRYLDVVGQARYGVLTVVWLLLGYFRVFDLGLGRASANWIAKLKDADAAERDRVLWAALCANAVFGLLGALALGGLGYVVVGHVLKLDHDLRRETLRALPVVAAAVPFVTVSAVLVGALEGLEQFLVANVVEVATIIVYQVAPLALAYELGPNLTAPIAAIALAPFVGAVAGFAACRRHGLARRRGRPDRATATALLRYGGWITVTGVVSPLMALADRLAIGTVSGARAVAQYTVPLNLTTRLSIVPLSFSRTLFPRLSYLDEKDAQALARESALALLALLTPLVVVGMIVLEPFLDVWVGHSLARVAGPVGVIVLIGVWLNSLAFVPFALLQARGRPDLPAKFHLLELAPYLVALWLGLRVGGIRGAAWAWSGRVVLDALLLFGSSWSAFRVAARSSVVPATLVLLAAVAILRPAASESARVVIDAVLVGASLASGWHALSARTTTILWHRIRP